MFSLRGKIAVVTGSAKGLGRAMTLALAEAGADIVGIDIIDQGETQAQVEALGRRYRAVQGDFSSPETMPQVAAEAVSALGRVDILLNNAGITPIYPAEDYPPEALDLVFDINVKSLYRLTQEIGRHMIANRYGRIVNVCSIQSMTGGNGVSAYVGTKHAVAGFTRAFGNEWGQYGITVNGIAPGYMITDNTAKLRSQPDKVAIIDAQIPAGRWGKPEDLQGPVVFLASDASSYVNGHLLVVDGGLLNS